MSLLEIIQPRVISVHSWYLTSLVNLSFYRLDDFFDPAIISVISYSFIHPVSSARRSYKSEFFDRFIVFDRSSFHFSIDSFFMPFWVFSFASGTHCLEPSPKKGRISVLESIAHPFQTTLVSRRTFFFPLLTFDFSFSAFS